MIFPAFQIFLAENDLNEVFGNIDPPGGPNNLSDPAGGTSTLLTVGIQVALFGGGILLLGYLLYGAFLWITSAGEAEKIEKARGTITQAIIGIILLVVGLSLFLLIGGTVLNIIKFDDNGGFYLELPSVRDRTSVGTGSG